MTTIRQLASGFDVMPLQRVLLRNPDLWDEFRFRTEDENSPHRDMQDIIVRYNERKNFDGDRDNFNNEHESVWYPCLSVIPEVKPLVFDLMRLVEGEKLGGIFITRLPPGKECYPHVDGSWHSREYEKYAIQIESAPSQGFFFDKDCLLAKPGDVYWFDNTQKHWVKNDSNFDRITMIVTIKSHKYQRRESCQQVG